MNADAPNDYRILMQTSSRDLPAPNFFFDETHVTTHANDASGSTNGSTIDSNDNFTYPLSRTTFFFTTDKCSHIFSIATMQLRSGDEAESVISVCELCGFKKIKN